MGFSSSPANEQTAKNLLAYSRKLLSMGKLAAEAAFHAKRGHEKEAQACIKKLERKAKDLAGPI